MPVDFESSPLQFLVSRQETHPQITQITQMIFQKKGWRFASPDRDH
jgi:hypothetical protein